jgi:tetraacyldisaccharide 4'-kinase
VKRDLTALHALAASGRPGPWWLGVLRAGLRGAAGLYGLGAGGKNLVYDLGLRKPRRLPAPVIGVGNLAVGGTGKTPLVMVVVRALLDLGLPAAVISRGYGAAAGRGGVTWVSSGQGPLSDARQAGDEPLLLARRLPVPVAAGPDRWEVGRAVLAQCGSRVLVCDDLFQHRRLHRDLDLVALDAARPLGNGHLLPAGHLREPAVGLRRAGALVLTRSADPAVVDQDRRWLRSFWGPGTVLACGHHLAGLDDAQGQPLPPETWRGRPVLAFCGLADPDQFAAGLKRAGLTVLDCVGFADHHFFTPDELHDLWRRAKDRGAAALVCSEKDWVRLPADLPAAPPLWVTRLELAFAPDQPGLASVLAWGLAAWGARA